MASGHDLGGTTVLVTGANRGVGRCFCSALLERDVARLYAASRRPDELGPVVALDPERVVPLHIDLLDHDTIAAAAQEASDVTILINNAAAAAFTLPTAADPEAVRTEMRTNYFGTFMMVRAFAPVIEANGGGAIVNVLSMSALASIPSMSGYSASKAASHSMTQAFRSDLRERGVAVQGAYPAGIDTDMLAAPELPSTPPEEVAADILDGIEAGDDYIFPGPLAKRGSETYLTDPVALERGFEGIWR